MASIPADRIKKRVSTVKRLSWNLFRRQFYVMKSTKWKIRHRRCTWIWEHLSKLQQWPVPTHKSQDDSEERGGREGNSHIHLQHLEKVHWEKPNRREIVLLKIIALDCITDLIINGFSLMKTKGADGNLPIKTKIWWCEYRSSMDTDRVWVNKKWLSFHLIQQGIVQILVLSSFPHLYEFIYLMKHKR